MAQKDDVIINIRTDTKAAVDSLKTLQDQVKGLSEAVKGSTKVQGEHEGALGKLSFAFIAGNQAVELAKKAYEALVEPIKEAINAYGQQEQALNKLGAAFKINGQDAKSNVADFREFAETLEKTTNTADEVTLSLAAMAKASGLSNAQTKTLIQTSVQLAAVTDKDVNGAFTQLLQQYSGMPGRIARTYPELQKFTPMMLKAGQGVEFLNARLKTFAEEDAKSLVGTFKGVTIATENFFKALGETIVKTIGLPDILEKRRHTWEELTKILKELQPKIIAFGEAFRNIDLNKVITGLLSAITVFAAFKAALFTYELISAVKAIGGLSAALEAMGGAKVILAGLTTSFAALRTAIATTLTTILPVLAIGVVFLTVAAAVEVLARNFEKMDQLLDLIKESAKVVGNSFLVAFDLIIVGVLKVNSSITGFLSNLTGLYSETAAAAKGDLLTAQENLAKKIADVGKNVDGVKESAKGIDFGLAGEGVKLVTGLLKGLTAETKKGEEAKGTGLDKSRSIIANLQEQIKLTQQLVEANASLATEINNINATTTDQIKNNLDLEMQKLNIKRKQLEAEGLLTGEQGKQIKAQLDLTEALSKQKAGKQTEMAEHPNAVSPDQLKAIKENLGEGAKGISDAIGTAVGGVSGLMSGAGAVMGAVNGVLDFVQQLIDFIPQVLNKVAGIFTSLTDLPMKILEGVKNLGKSIVGFVTGFIPNLLKMIPQLLLELIDHAFSKLPDAVIGLAKMLPDLLVSFIEQLPEIVEKFISGVISNGPRLVIGIIEGLVKGIPRFVIALVKGFYIELPKAIIKGIIEGLKGIGNLFKGVKMDNPIDTAALANSMKQAAKTLTNEASKLFKVTDLGTSGESVKEKADALMAQIDDSAKAWFQGIIEAWRKIYDNFIKPFIETLNAAWQAFVEYVYMPLKRLWDYVIQALMSAWNALKTIWQTVLDLFSGKISFFGAVAKIWHTVFEFAEEIFNRILSAFNSILSKFGDVGTSIWNGFKSGFSGIGDMLGDVGTQVFETLKNAFKKIFDTLNPINLLEKIFHLPEQPGPGTVEEKLGINIPFVTFAEGGYVPGQAMVPGNSPVNDKIISLLSPGEAVIPRDKMHDPRIAAVVKGILSGKVQVPKHYFGQSVVEGVQDAAGAAASQAQQAAQGAADHATEAYHTASDAATDYARNPTGVYEKLRDQSAEVLQGVWDKINPLNQLWNMVWDKLKEGMNAMISANHFANGGFVSGGTAGVDSVSAMLMPGEFVMNKQATQRIGAGNLAAMNSGGAGGGGATTNNFNINIDIKPTQNIDDNFVRNRMVPIMKEELKRASLDGKTVIFSGGIR